MWPFKREVKHIWDRKSSCHDDVENIADKIRSIPATKQPKPVVPRAPRHALTTTPYVPVTVQPVVYEDDTSSNVLGAVVAAEIISSVMDSGGLYSAPEPSFSGGGGDFGGGGSSASWSSDSSTSYDSGSSSYDSGSSSGDSGGSSGGGDY
jgi:hypothetical protein